MLSHLSSYLWYLFSFLFVFQLLVTNPKAFENFSHIILDEIHERDMDSDLASLVVKLLAKENIKLIIMSATLQGDMFLRYKIILLIVPIHRFLMGQARNGGEKDFDWTIYLYFLQNGLTSYQLIVFCVTG